jgi:hypothetical protein
MTSYLSNSEYILTGASLASTSEVWTSAILEELKQQYKKSYCQGHFQWHDLPTEFHTILLLGSKVIGGHTDRQNGDLLSLAFHFKESRLEKKKVEN